MHYPAVKGSLFNFTLIEVIDVLKSYAHIQGHIHIHHGNLHIKIGASLNHMYKNVIKYSDVFTKLLIFFIPFVCLKPNLDCDLPKTQVMSHSKGRSGDYIRSVLKYDTSHKTSAG